MVVFSQDKKGTVPPVFKPQAQMRKLMSWKSKYGRLDSDTKIGRSTSNRTPFSGSGGDTAGGIGSSAG